MILSHAILFNGQGDYIDDLLEEWLTSVQELKNYSAAILHKLPRYSTYIVCTVITD